MQPAITTLRIKKQYSSDIELAMKWFSILKVLNGFQWNPMEIKILAYTAVKGDISSGGRIDGFCELFGSTVSSVANSISILYKKHFLVKTDGKTRVNPQFLQDFGNDMLLQLKLVHVREESIQHS